MDIHVTEARENMYLLDDDRVRCFLFIGDKDALLIDSGFPDTDVVSKVKTITDLPIHLVLTHADMDHTGGLKTIGECSVHKEDIPLISCEAVIHTLSEGDHVGAGDYDFKVISIPGHTYGSIALLDEKHRMILTGDTVQKNGPIYMFGDSRDFPLYIESLKKLNSITDQFDLIYPSHNICPLKKEAAGRCLEDAVALYEGRITAYEKHPFMPCNTYHGKYTDFYYQPK